MSWHYVKDERDPCALPICGETGAAGELLFITSSQPSLVGCEACRSLMPKTDASYVDPRGEGAR